MLKRLPIALLPLCSLFTSQTSLLGQESPLPPEYLHANHGSHLFLRGDFLYLQSNETGLGYAMNQLGFADCCPEDMSIGSIANPKFEWNSGFRLGIGYNIPHDQWDLGLIWTAYQGKAGGSTASRRENNPTVYPTYIHPNAFNDENIFSCMSANSALTIDFNNLDLDLGRQFMAGKWLSLRPHFGIRTAWINQTYDLTYNSLYTYNLDTKLRTLVLDEYLTHIINNYWGLGIQGGIDSQWALGLGLSIYGNFTTSLIYGLFENSYTEMFSRDDRMDDDIPAIEGVPLSEENHFHAGRAILDLQLGLRYSTSVRKEKMRIVLQGGWEQHIFFSQNQILRFVDGQNWGNFVQNQGDLYFQGWSASASLFF